MKCLPGEGGGPHPPYISCTVFNPLLTDHISYRVVRASLGAMSTRSDIDTFIMFLRETFLDQGFSRTVAPARDSESENEMAGLRRNDVFYHDHSLDVAKEEVAVS